MPWYNAMEQDFEEVTILDMPALFTPLRIDRSTVPDGYQLYEVRHDDDCQGDAVQIARSIVVNHWGSLITRDEIKLPPDGFLDIEPEDMNYSTGECRSMKEFMEKYPTGDQLKEKEKNMSQDNQCTCPLCNQGFTPADGLTADEHLARGILKAYAEMQGKGEHENGLPCPRCGEYSMSSDVLRNALSRQYDIHICDLCGNREGVEASESKTLPIESWWVVTEILKRK